MTTDTRRLAEESTVVALVQNLVHQVQVWIANSWLATKGTTLRSTLETAASTSGIATATKILARYVRHSFLYRWLTTEPDPDVIVIDLRETYTVGPLIALLDRLALFLVRTWRGSLTRRSTERVRTATIWAWVAESRTIRLLAAALEPPEPVENHDRE